MVKRISSWIDRLFNEHKLVRRAGVTTMMILFVGAVYLSFTQLALLTAPVAAALSTMAGALAAMFKFYQDSRDKEK